MRIGSSTIEMMSGHSLKKTTQYESASLIGHKGSEIMLDTASGKSLFRQLKDEGAAREKNSRLSPADNSVTRGEISDSNGFKNVKSVYELKMTLLEQMLDAIKKRQVRLRQMAQSGFSMNFAGLNAGIENSDSNGIYVSQKVESFFYKEEENTAFVSEGKVLTKDGREISFAVSFEMSRSFEEKYELYTEKTFRLCDPLVFNFEGNTAELTDQRFLFDLDCDGKEEEISGLGKGSGFLALDKNGNGKIDDGTELFGTKSGDGFKDLALYDDDGNGWIDEDDEIFSGLKIWSKGENGEDRLISLREAGIGAICLAHTDTAFSEKNNFNELMGMIRSTGIFLYEDGGAGTLQHVDFSV